MKKIAIEVYDKNDTLIETLIPTDMEIEHMTLAEYIWKEGYSNTNYFKKGIFVDR
jgi:hypothetical protein